MYMGRQSTRHRVHTYGIHLSFVGVLVFSFRTAWNLSTPCLDARMDHLGSANVIYNHPIAVDSQIWREAALQGAPLTIVRWYNWTKQIVFSVFSLYLTINHSKVAKFIPTSVPVSRPRYDILQKRMCFSSIIISVNSVYIAQIDIYYYSISRVLRQHSAFLKRCQSLYITYANHVTAKQYNRITT